MRKDRLFHIPVPSFDHFELVHDFLVIFRKQVLCVLDLVRKIDGEIREFQQTLVINVFEHFGEMLEVDLEIVVYLVDGVVQFLDLVGHSTQVDLLEIAGIELVHGRNLGLKWQF